LAQVHTKEHLQFIKKENATVKCPYCQSDINDASGFCSKCGQAISICEIETKESDDFWKKTERDVMDRNTQINRIREVEQKNKDKATKNKIVISIVSVLAILAMVLIITSVNSGNEEKLRLAMESVKGKKYTDKNTPQSFYSLPASFPTKDLKFNNDGTVDYYYCIRETDYRNDRFEYTDLEVKGTGCYKYEMNISFFGEISISLYKNGYVWETYEVELDDKGRVESIDMFD